MAISVRAVHIIVIVFPILGPCIIGRVDVNAVHLFCIQVLQQLESMVVIGFDEGMPKVAVRRVLHKVQRLQRGINRLPKFRHSNDIAHLERFLLMCLSTITQHSIPINFQNGINVTDITGFQCNLAPDTDRHIVKWCTFRQMFFKNQAELLLFYEFFRLLHDPLTKYRIVNLLDQILQKCHGFYLILL